MAVSTELVSKSSTIPVLSAVTGVVLSWKLALSTGLVLKSSTGPVLAANTEWISSGEIMKLFIKMHFEWIMSKIEKLKVVKILRRQFANNLTVYSQYLDSVYSQH